MTDEKMLVAYAHEEQSIGFAKLLGKEALQIISSEKSFFVKFVLINVLDSGKQFVIREYSEQQIYRWTDETATYKSIGSHKSNFALL